MLVRNPKAMTRGLLLLVSFIAVFITIFMPIFPISQGRVGNGLEFSDHLFNTLSKGSTSGFIKETRQKVKAVENVELSVNSAMKKAELAPLALKMLQTAGITASVAGNTVTLNGNLGKVLYASLDDAAVLYKNDGQALAAKYSLDDGQKCLEVWWQLFSGMIKPLQKDGHIVEAQVVDAVMRKGLEPSYNFYGIEDVRIGDNILLVTALLVFYIIYTMWYGFAIFEIFEGIGLTMTKGVKKEA